MIIIIAKIFMYIMSWKFYHNTYGKMFHDCGGSSMTKNVYLLLLSINSIAYYHTNLHIYNQRNK